MFKEGTKISAIYLGDEDGGAFAVGDEGIVSIEVVDVCGQMSYVPWAKVSFSDGAPIMVNLATVAIVHMAFDAEENKT